MNSPVLPEPAALAPARKSSFVERYGAVFGREQGLMLRMAGLTAAEQSADGSWITDDTGRRWLDFGSFGLHLLGHRHPVVVAALIHQVASLGLSSRILANEPGVSAAERLAASVGRPGNGVLYGNSGSEVIEAALKLVRMQTGKRRVIALKYAYHGRTSGALAVSYGYRGHAALMHAEDVVFIDAGDLDAARETLAEDDIAAVIAEPVQGEGGIRPLDLRFLTDLARLCREHGAFMIHDEIQSGLGRSGALVCGAPADIIVFGKTLGGGVFPVAAAIYDSSQFGAPARDPVVHASSYAGSALAGAVVNAVLDVVGDPAFCERVNALGKIAMNILRNRLQDCPAVAEVRGSGLMIGVEFTSSQYVAQTLIEAAHRNVLVAFCLSATHVLRVYPDATISAIDLEQGINSFCDAIDAAYLSIQ
ncbi:aminotransferase class III-fold pyridoxal phosphate-dependent enzyme [Pseudomonas tremae]|uniref:aspartate aminotransferase family protein n=1 Tax=Pseudomonas syringae group TaxID=136849 RepID=UPI000F0042B6|nr:MULTISPECIES: aminotransferase class III-fold pyridoxal phosphate-dependent enzyme [Pseudomonas syringae group]MCF5745600.1 aminotransferase class III-fold pyridoxal phosphate-dependent enzyme [Pseudomonas tremae]MCF5803881.1 aminotransferase class III-fold pyridoxal phosphate-dependent enzyme [Pseudomonas tremae]MCF5808902.1 aminotransferase class III-fold pyridoxal phosphate-dependent enzyme [Pseudomonas tremae]MCQ2990128.1 aminotransferase class III-fold pyridoxal phosphate-dependent enzy